MNNLIGILLWLVIGYICGTIFEPALFPTNLRAINFYNAHVWFWLIGWPVMLVLEVLPGFLANPNPR